MSALALPTSLPAELVPRFLARRESIQNRLADFAAVPKQDWFYELCFCLLTPQSKAAHADLVVQELQALNFKEAGGEVVQLLRTPDHYIRFHNQKAHRLQMARLRWTAYAELLEQPLPAIELRNILASEVLGFGLKEASHFMRNVGFRGLGILDRHLLTFLVRCGLYQTTPSVSTTKTYWEVERSFQEFAQATGYDMDELDLFFWSEMTGYILK